MLLDVCRVCRRKVDNFFLKVPKGKKKTEKSQFVFVWGLWGSYSIFGDFMVVNLQKVPNTTEYANLPKKYSQVMNFLQNLPEMSKWSNH